MSVVWTPQAGPQFYATTAKWADELLYGGARGGGKTSWLLGDFLQDVAEYGADWNGIIFRRHYKELEEIIRQSEEMYRPTGAEYNKSDHVWKWPNGAQLKFRYLEREQDLANYQGHQYCVEENTLIATNKGEVPIKDLLVGDKVQTLEGYKQVQHKIESYRSLCVRVRTTEGEQIHPVTHPFLTSLGWQSFSSLLGIDSKKIEEKFLKGEQLPSLNIFVRSLKHVEKKGVLKSRSSILSHLSYMLSLLSGDKHSVLWRRILKISEGLRPEELNFRETLDYKSLLSFLCALVNVEIEKNKVLSSLNRYLYARDLYDGLLLLARENGLSDIPSRDGVEAPFLLNCILDAVESIPLDSRPYVKQYEHPYTFQVREASEDSFFEPCEISIAGYYMVSDIQVEDSNHYISAKTGIINKNTFVGIDELGDWPHEGTYKRVRALCRWTKREVPVKRVRCTANPGGIGHAWIKRYFIDPAPLGFKVLKSKTTGMSRVYVPAKVTDNKILMERDPYYINKLKDLGSEDMVKAWLYGDWNIVAGAYFTQFRKHHIIQPFKVPETWTRFVAMDWGFAKDPFAVLWCAVADGSTEHPRGAVIVYRELYGANEKGETFEWIPQQVAQRINYLSMGERIDYYVADPSIFNRYNGISTGEMFAREGLYFQKGDNSRQIGWEQVRIRLVGVNDRPLIYFFSTCAKIIETLPIAPSDLRDPTDIDTKCDDHALDALRYGLMSRPWISDVVESKKNINELTLDELFELNERRRSVYSERI